MRRNRTIIVFAAVSIVSCATAAFAYEDPSNKIGDRYPFLEQRNEAVSTVRLASTTPMLRQVSNSYSYASEDADQKIGDRYPFLEPITRPVAAVGFAGRYLTAQQTARSVANAYAYEDADQKIGDRYPFLEQRVAAQPVLHNVASRRVNKKHI